MSQGDEIKAIEKGRSRRVESIYGLLGVMAFFGFVTSNSWAPALRDSYVATAEAYAEGKRAEAGLDLKKGDYNGNEIIDRFYVIDGEKVPYEVDGRPAREYFPDTQ